MRREDRDGVLVLGHWGRSLLVFPSQERTRYEWEEHGMVDTVADLIDAGRVKLYCVDAWDSVTWCDDWLPSEERARRYEGYERWLLDHVYPGRVHFDIEAPAGTPSRWNTLRALRVLDWWETA